MGDKKTSITCVAPDGYRPNSVTRTLCSMEKPKVVEHSADLPPELWYLDELVNEQLVNERKLNEGKTPLVPEYDTENGLIVQCKDQLSKEFQEKYILESSFVQRQTYPLSTRRASAMTLLLKRQASQRLLNELVWDGNTTILPDLNKLTKLVPEQPKRSLIDRIIQKYVIARRMREEEITEEELKRVRLAIVRHIKKHGTKNILTTFVYRTKESEEELEFV
ncbi:hypothetical protein EG68_03399 [Paragonimus skrjabini miyazakii]|uniref:Uncharacterized protein n=1 Tax=Paragonimus skrjabini miyazakii TaxID=59628 RepID=A0A8S9YY02_9TREM|nr:hypothetical protein EG68_03399 [Paragonimus skrjabini miyazakii]